MRLRWHFAPATSSLARVVCVSVVSLSLAGYFAWQYQTHQSQLQEQRTEDQQSRDFLHRLDQPVKLHFGKTVTMREWLAEWSRQTGVPAVAQPVEQPDYALPTIDRKFTLDLPEVSARTALHVLAEREDLHWHAVAGERIELYFIIPGLSVSKIPREVVTYPLPPGLARIPPEELAELVQTHVRCMSWYAPGRGDIVAAPGQLCILQTADVQLQIADFLRALQAAQEQATSLPRAGLAPYDERLQPMLLYPQRDDWLPQFEQPVSLDLVAVPLPQFAQLLSAPTGIPFSVDQHELTDHGRKPNDPITFQAKQVRLRTALAVALDANEFSYRPLSGGAVLQIADEGSDSDYSHLCTIAYPAADLLPADNEDQREYVNQLKLAVAPDSWQQNHHWSGSCQLQVVGNLLIARVPLRIHWELQDLLTAIRRVRLGLEGARVRAGFDAQASREMQTAYERPAALSYREIRVRDLLADLRTQFHLPITNTKYAAFDLETRVSCDFPVRPLRENLELLLNPHRLRIVPTPEYLLLTDASDAENSWFVTQVFDLRQLQTRLEPKAIRRLIAAAIQPDSWNDNGGPGTLVELNGLLVMRNQSLIVDRANAMLQFIERDLQHPRRSLPSQPSVPADSWNPLLALAELHLLERNYELPRTGAYYVGHLLQPHGRLTPTELLDQCELIDPVPSNADPFPESREDAVIHFNRILVVELTPLRHEQLQKKLRTLREESQP